ncbi:MAG: hypothetical protein AAF518_05140 [Spirochaetota bacterium]
MKHTILAIVLYLSQCSPVRHQLIMRSSKPMRTDEQVTAETKSVFSKMVEIKNDRIFYKTILNKKQEIYICKWRKVTYDKKMIFSLSDFIIYHSFIVTIPYAYYRLAKAKLQEDTIIKTEGDFTNKKRTVKEPFTGKVFIGTEEKYNKEFPIVNGEWSISIKDYYKLQFEQHLTVEELQKNSLTLSMKRKYFYKGKKVEGEITEKSFSPDSPENKILQKKKATVIEQLCSKFSKDYMDFIYRSVSTTLSDAELVKNSAEIFALQDFICVDFYHNSFIHNRISGRE